MTEIIYCKKTVYPNERWGSFHGHRCKRKSWKDGYCKVHHPDSVKTRQDEAMTRFRKKWDQSPEMRLSRALDRIHKLEAAIDKLWPHIHEEAMRGESDFERAWLAVEKARKS